MEFRTIKQDGIVEDEIKKSRFICHIKRVTTEEEARDFITSIKKGEIKRTSDDGEPSGTAGVPMLGVLENHQLTNLCAVVTRYFGGIKLGAGGLIRAYAGSVALAIKEIGVVEIKEQVGLRLQLSYSQYQEYGNFLKAENLTELDSEFTDTVSTSIFVDKNDQSRIENALIEFFNGKITLTNQGVRKVEVPIS